MKQETLISSFLKVLENSKKGDAGYDLNKMDQALACLEKKIIDSQILNDNCSEIDQYEIDSITEVLMEFFMPDASRYPHICDCINRTKANRWQTNRKIRRGYHGVKTNGTHL